MGEAINARQRHASYFLRLFEDVPGARLLYDPQGFDVIRQLDQEHANCMAALDWLDQSEQGERMARLVAHLADCWYCWRHAWDRGKWLDKAEAAARDRVDRTGALLLTERGTERNLNGDLEAGLALYKGALAIYQTSGHEAGMMEAASLCGVVAGRLNQYVQAREFQRQALASAVALGDERWVLNARSTYLARLGSIAMLEGAVDEAERCFEGAVQLQRDQGSAEGMSHIRASNPVAGLGDVARVRGNHVAAFHHYMKSLHCAWDFQDQIVIGIALGGAAGALAAAGECRPASRCFGAAEAYYESIGIPFALSTFDRQRALGLPEPWQREHDSFDKEEHL